LGGLRKWGVKGGKGCGDESGSVRGGARGGVREGRDGGQKKKWWGGLEM